MDSSKVIETLQSAEYIEVEDEMYKSLLTLQMKCTCPERFDNISSLENRLWVIEDATCTKCFWQTSKAVYGVIINVLIHHARHRPLYCG